MRRIQTVILAGLVSGALDIVAAFASYAAQGATAEGILKYIASGLLGASAMQGGMGTAGLACCFTSCSPSAWLRSSCWRR